MHALNPSCRQLVVALLAFSQLACARVPHHRHHRRHDITSTVESNAAVVEGPPDNAIVSVVPPPNNAVVDVTQTTSVDTGAGITVSSTYMLQPSSTTVLEISSYVVSDAPVPTGVSSLVNPTATSMATCVDDTPTDIPISTIIPTTSVSNFTVIVTPVDTLTNIPISTIIPTTTSVSNLTVIVTPVVTFTSSTISSGLVSSVYPTISINSSIAINSTITLSNHASATESVAFNITSTRTFKDVSPTITSTRSFKNVSPTITSSKASKSWASLSIPTSVKTFVRVSTSTSLPPVTDIPTTPRSSLLLSFSMPTYSSRKPTSTSIIDLSTLPANVSANTPCYNKNCSNPESGMNYHTTVSASANINNTLFTGGAMGRHGGLAAAAAVACVLWGVVLLL